MLVEVVGTCFKALPRHPSGGTDRKWVPQNRRLSSWIRTEYFLCASRRRCYFLISIKQSEQLWILRVTPLAQTRMRRAGNYSAISLTVRGGSCGPCLPSFFSSFREVLTVFLVLAVLSRMRSGFSRARLLR
jgi:hypothetical protein